jgi:hypothetical protein
MVRKPRTLVSARHNTVWREDDTLPLKRVGQDL